MSCEMKMKLRFSRFWISSSRSRIWLRIETSSADSRLVGDDDARIERERAGDADALALAAREGVRIALHRHRIEADELHQLGDALLQRVPLRQPVHDERIADHLLHRHARIERGERVLEDEAHVAVESAELALAELGDVDLPALVAAIGDRARGRLDGAQDQPAERRLAGAAFADDAEVFAGIEVEADVVDGAQRTCAVAPPPSHRPSSGCARRGSAAALSAALATAGSLRFAAWCVSFTVEASSRWV